MFKPNKLLKVISVLIILSAVFDTVNLIIGKISLDSIKNIEGIEQKMIDALEAGYTPLAVSMSIVAIVVALTAGILGIAGRAYRVAWICMIVYIGGAMVNFFQNQAAMTEIQVSLASILLSAVISLILPILYLWGLYQSKDS